MAKQTGIFNFEGTLDNVTFYKTEDGLLVRKKSGVNKQRIKNDAAFVRTRENCAEFANCAKCASTFRQTAAIMVNRARDSKLSSRIIKVFFAIKKLDTVNLRGERSVGQGLTTAAGKALLKNFDFNRHSNLHSVLAVPYVLNPSTSTITFDALNPLEALNFPEGATHFGLQNAVMHIDLIGGTSEIGYSEVLNYPISNSIVTPVLTPSTIPTASGTKIYLLLITFYQEVNGLQYVLHNGTFNALSVIEVL